MERANQLLLGPRMVNADWNDPFYHIEYTGKYSADYDIASNYTISSTGGEFF